VFKEEQKEYALRTNKKLAREIEHHQEFVDRFGAKATMASRAQSKSKHIAKLRKKIAGVHADLATTKIKIQCPLVPPGTAVYAEEVSVGYGDKVIVDKINFHINRGDKVVIAGENGQGKTTLLKTLAGILEPLSGKLKWWHHADIGYYDQKVDATLIPNETVLNYLMRMAPHISSGERILMMAGNFLFRDDDLEKPTSVLSGGERARLCLAGILLHEHSVLLLDEPTNHLDVETAEALAIALKQYEGTVIFVSHARTFVNALCDKVLEIRFGTLRNYPGPYEEYVSDLAEIMEMEARDPKTSSITKNGSGADHMQARVEKAEARAKLKELQRAVERLEKLMKVLDRERSEILQFYFENPTEYAPEKATRLGELDEEYKQKEDEWFKWQEEIEML
jgi:ATP-binding cassette subfamily F protein 3